MQVKEKLRIGKRIYQEEYKIFLISSKWLSDKNYVVNVD
jgi:hypothetical protein